ncbi:Lrp/AsnC family transcriptional regulator [Citreimonas sp.]|uniref:Lrp/AsnC family transcriptional regulator n=1 Tax=Citreimonas sp. TaxID=3036715 RepID=UPI004059507F
MTHNIDQIDKRILTEMQADGGLSQRELAERVGLSQNACWRRLRNLEARGIIQGRRTKLDRVALGKKLVVFTMLRTRRHSIDWLAVFRNHVTSIPDIVDFHRIGGDYDYMIKIVTDDMASFDRVYQQLIGKIELDAVTSYFAMETILEDRAIPL